MESSKAGSSGGSSGGNGSQQQLESWHERKGSVNLRDLLKVKDDDSNNNHPKPSGLTLGDALNDQRNSSRTLYDIIRDDNKDKKSWKNFKDKLRLHHGGSAWTSSVHIPASDVPMQPNNNNYYNNSNTSSNNNRMMMMRRPSTRLNVGEEDGAPSASANGVEVRPEPSSLLSSRSMARLGSTRGAHLNVSSEGNAAAADEEDEVAEGEEGEGEGETTEEGEAAAEGRDGTGRMSLLDLLSETDRSMGIDGSSFMMDDEDDEEEESGGGGGGGGGEYSNCCVCMVRHKGAAFIPCGHTFCRLCSRELWVQRGNCPLCNNFILEILDIF